MGVPKPILLWNCLMALCTVEMCIRDRASSDLLYNSFVAYLNEQKDPIAPIIRSACQTVQLYLETLSYIQPANKEEETDELYHETK